MVTSVRVEDRLDGASNFSSWKSRLTLVLEENDILSYMEEEVPEPQKESEKFLWKRNQTKARKIVVDSLKNHLVLHVSELKTAKAMFDALKNLFENNNTNRVLALRHQLHYIKMTNDETVESYFMKVSQLRDD